MKRNMTEGSVMKNLIFFSLPYLMSCFLQTFYGLADLFITGQFNGSEAITAVSVGSQLTHMLTVVVVGLAMGATVTLGHSVGAGKPRESARCIGNTVVLFAVFSCALTLILLLARGGIIQVLKVPEEAVSQTRDYITVCFIGIPCITAYNVISSVFRGLGDSRSPMIFVFAAGVINVILDYVLIGPMGMGAFGAALATVISQACSVLFALAALKRMNIGISLSRNDFLPDKRMMMRILKVGFPIALQDGLIQISFLVITTIANSRGVTIAAAVGIVEKIISFLFLVPSAMLSTISAIAAQNDGAGKPDRARAVLRYGLIICVVYGIIVSVIVQFAADQIVWLFSREDAETVYYGGQYFRAYAFDTIFAGIHFCFSGYFCAYRKAILSFIHNIASIVLVRIPGAWLAAVLWPATLYPMGLAAPLGSLLSALICIFAFYYYKRKGAFE